MSKFEVLKYNKLFFNTDARGTFITCNVLINIGLLSTSYVYFMVENSSQFRSILEACLVLIGMSQAVGAYLFVRLNAAKITAFHTKLQQIIDEGLMNMTFSPMSVQVIFFWSFWRPLSAQ